VTIHFVDNGVIKGGAENLDLDASDTAPPLVQLLRAMREATLLYRRGAISRAEFQARRRALLDRF
jgi:hypothetical protein